jgi:hypothetical protein
VPYADRERQKAANREFARRRRARNCGTNRVIPVGPLLPRDFRLRRADDVLALLEVHVLALHADSSLTIAERARTVAYLASIALRGIEAANLQSRVEALEEILSSRADAA